MKTKLVIFGITGDLSRRKLLPALEKIVAHHSAQDLELIGVSRREVDIDELLRDLPSLQGKTSMVSMDLTRQEDYARLAQHVQLQPDEQLLVYLSVPPMAAAQIADFLGEAGLNGQNVKLLFEKPFGVDLESAKEVIARTSRYFSDAQIYRIDHYLAKEMAQNIIAIRQCNALFTHLWNYACIEKIEVIASEEIGIEGRGVFYEQTGALRDIAQGHLMQLLALTLMDIPDEFHWDDVPSLRLAALRSLHPADPNRAIRAQYAGYTEEAEAPDSQVETFVAIELTSDDARWKNVPMYLITGKSLAEKTTEIRITLRRAHEAQSNIITFRIQPNEGVGIELFVKQPGYSRQFERHELGFGFPEETTLPDAYEHVLVEAIESRKSLFTCSEEVIRSWELLADVQRAWNRETTPIAQYEKGTTSDDVRAQHKDSAAH